MKDYQNLKSVFQLVGKKTKDALYQLTDFYTLFYYQFLQKKRDDHYWTIQTDTSVRNTWCGLAFERVCFEHVNEIKVGLGISGVLTIQEEYKL